MLYHGQVIYCILSHSSIFLLQIICIPHRNYAPVKKEHVAMPVEVVQGAIPKELYGAFLRNGPNPCFEKAVKRYHWFDGHAMLVCISYYVLLQMIYYILIHWLNLYPLSFYISIHSCSRTERQDILISSFHLLGFQLRENWVSSSSLSLESTKVGYTVAEMLVIQLIQNPNYLHRGVRFLVKLPVLQEFLQICLVLHKNHKIIAKRGLLLTDY